MHLKCQGPVITVLVLQMERVCVCVGGGGGIIGFEMFLYQECMALHFRTCTEVELKRKCNINSIFPKVIVRNCHQAWHVSLP